MFVRAGVVRSFGFTGRRGLRTGSRRPGGRSSAQSLVRVHQRGGRPGDDGGAADSSAADGRHPGSHPATAAGTSPAGRRSSHPGRSAVLLAPGPARVDARAAGSADVHVLVMRIYWSDKQPKSPDHATMHALMQDTAAWFKRVSRGRHHVTSG